jgi:Secretion system C-terminal sorting domain
MQFPLPTSKYLSVPLLFLLIFASFPAQELKNKNATNFSPEDEAIERMQWDLKRLADPATGKIPQDVRAREIAFSATLPNDANSYLGKSVFSTPFTSRGPWNVGGKTSAFAIDASNENRLLAGTTSGGMWLSTDGGQSWTLTNSLSQLRGANCLTQDTRPNHRNVWYYGGGNPWASAGGGGSAYFLGDGIFKSIDSGLTWQSLASTASGNPNGFTTGWQIVYSIANDISAPDSTAEIYAATYGAIYRSTNGGTSWTSVRSGNSYFTEVVATSSGIIYATLSDDGTQKGIWRSTDGITFTNITPATFPAAYNRIVMGVNPNDENEIYFLANTPGYGKKVLDFQGDAHWNSLWKYNYLSGNGDSLGGSWMDLSMNLPATGGMFDKFHTQDSYDMLVKVKPGNANVVFLGGTNLYRSTTGFQDSLHTTFIGGYEEGSAYPTINSYLNHHPDQHCLEFLPSNPNSMINANDGGVFRTDNDLDSIVSWNPLNNGYVTTMFYTVAIDHGNTNNDIICGGTQDNGTWWTNNANMTSPWKHVHGGDGAYCAIADNQSAYYFAIQNLRRLVKVSLDVNGNQTGFRRIDPIGGKGYQWMNPYLLDPNNNNIMYLAGGKYLWRNNDLSQIPLSNQYDSISTNWVQWNDSIPTALSEMTALAVSKTPANRVYYGTDKKRVYRVDNANTGTPTPIDITSTTTTALFPNTGYVSNITVDPHDGNKLMVIFSNYNVYSVFYSKDAGATWEKAGGNLEAANTISPSIRWGAILHVTDGTLYFLATSTGLYCTDTLMGTNTVWVQQGTNTIGNAVCDMIDVRESDGLVVVATHANGIYSAKITSVNDVVSSGNILNLNNELELKNYPNPFTGSTTIEFILKNTSDVRLDFWDDCGRIIESKTLNHLDAGKHTYQWDASKLKSGTYYCSMNVNGKRKVTRLIVLN